MRRFGALLTVALLVACDRDADSDTEQAQPDTLTTAPAAQDSIVAPRFDDATPQNAMDVELRDGNGRAVGVARLATQGNTIQVRVRVAGLSPGDHGIHIHEAGRCEPPTFESALTHLNPAGKQHGSLNPQGPHAGDLPNLTVGADGTADVTLTVQGLELHGSAANGLMREGGTSLVIHAAPDDLRTDPSGTSGPRVACGVISTA